MNRTVRTAMRGFSLLLRLYPADFREMFGEEMRGVFEEKLAAEQCAGVVSRIGMVFREFADLTVRALAQHIKGRTGKEHPMTTDARRVRLPLILSPILLTAFLAAVNPRYMARVFSDSLGWGMIAAVILGLFVCTLVWPASTPSNSGRRFVENFVLTFLLLAMNMSIMLGPALVMAFGSGSLSGAGRDYGVTLRWIVFAIAAVLAAAVAVMGVRKVQAMKKKSRA